MNDLDELALLKANVGITSTVRDDYLTQRLNATKSELQTKGINVSSKDSNAFLFWVDYTAWQYRNRGEGIMPRNLQYRMRNLIINSAKGGDDDATSNESVGS